MMVIVRMAAMHEPVVQARRHIDEEPPKGRTRAEVRGELTVDLKRPPVSGLPILKGLEQILFLLSSHRKKSAVAFRPHLDPALRVEFEAVPARTVLKPAGLELKFLRRRAKRRHHGTDIKIGH